MRTLQLSRTGSTTSTAFHVPFLTRRRDPDLSITATSKTDERAQTLPAPQTATRSERCPKVRRSSNASPSVPVPTALVTLDCGAQNLLRANSGTRTTSKATSAAAEATSVEERPVQEPALLLHQMRHPSHPAHDGDYAHNIVLSAIGYRTV